MTRSNGVPTTRFSVRPMHLEPRTNVLRLCTVNGITITPCRTESMIMTPMLLIMSIGVVSLDGGLVILGAIGGGDDEVFFTNVFGPFVGTLCVYYYFFL